MRADTDQVRADDDPGRAGVVGGAGGSNGEEIEVGTGASVVQAGIGQAREGSIGGHEGAENAKGLPPGHPQRVPRRLRCGS